MAERRMFTQKIVDSDAFLDMPLSAQCLYFHLSMRADDDGFTNNPKKVARMIGASEDDLKLLVAKRFILTFDSGVVVVKHWFMHNTIRKDRYHPTQYQEEKNTLIIKENSAYTEAGRHPDNQLATTWQPNGNQMATEEPESVATEVTDTPETEVRLGKDRLSKEVVVSKNISTPKKGDGPEPHSDDGLKEIFTTMENCGFILSGFMRDEVAAMLGDGIPPKWISEAVKRSAERGKKNMGYIKAIAYQWQEQGFIDEPTAEGKEKSEEKKRKRREAEYSEKAEENRKRIEEQLGEAFTDDGSGAGGASEALARLRR